MVAPGGVVVTVNHVVKDLVIKQIVSTKKSIKRN